MDIGEKIKEGRKLKRLSQNALATYVGVEQHTVSRWENNLVSPSYENLIVIAKVLNKPIAWFFGETKIEEPDIPISERNMIEQILKNTEKILKQTSLSQAVNHINNNIIPFPSVKRIRSFSFIDQPVGAGKTLADCKITGKFRMETPVDADYAFFVSGSSMAPDIIDGDLLLVKATRKWKERDIVIVYIPETDEWTVKQIYYGKGGYSVALRGTWETENYKERDIFIQGVVREVIRDKTIISEIMEKMEETGKIKEPKEIHERIDEEIDDRS